MGVASLHEGCQYLKSDLIFFQILTEIFKFLDLRDRKSARLVCKKWNEILLQRVFRKRQVFYIPRWYNLRLVAAVLENCSYEKVALKFVLGKWDSSDSDPRYFWQTVGNKIESIYFDRCECDVESLPFIFKHCVNLEVFDSYQTYFFRSSDSYFLEFGNENASSESDRFTNQSLQKLLIDRMPLEKNDIGAIAAAFPRLEVLEIKLGGLPASNYSFSWETITEIYAQADILPDLKTLIVSGHFDRDQFRPTGTDLEDQLNINWSR